MSDVTAAINTIAQVAVSYRDRKIAASTHIYGGTLVCINASGYLVGASDAANLKFDGYAEADVDNSAGSNGDKLVRVTPAVALGVIEIDAVSPDQTWIDEVIAVKDNHSGALLVQVTHEVRIGRCIDVIKTGTSGRILVDTRDRHTTSLSGS